MGKPILMQADIDAALGKVKKRARGVGVVVEEKVKEVGEDSDFEAAPSEPALSKASHSDEAVAFDHEELAGLHADYMDLDADDTNRFYLHLRVGEYIHKKEGVASNATASFARGGLVRCWCDTYS